MEDAVLRSESEKRRRGNDIQKSEEEVTIVLATSDWTEMNQRMANMEADLQRERSKRRDIEEDVEKQEKKWQI
jgi:hypothetical protein